MLSPKCTELFGDHVYISRWEARMRDNVSRASITEGNHAFSGRIVVNNDPRGMRENARRQSMVFGMLVLENIAMSAIGDNLVDFRGAFLPVVQPKMFDQTSAA